MDLSKMLSLGLREISREILEILACLPLVGLEMGTLFVGFLLDWEETHCLKDIFLLLAVNLFQLNSYIADKNSHVANLNSTICKISLAILFSNGCCLINAAILRRKHMIFFAFPAKHLSKPNNKIKLPSHSCESAGWLS